MLEPAPAAPPRDRGEPKPHIQSVTVMKRKRSPGAIEYLVVKCLAAAPTQASEQSLDVLACSQGVDRKVGTGTVVIEQARPSHRYPVSSVAGRAYGIISVQVPIRPGQNAHDASVSPFATRRNLLFDYHKERLSSRVNAHQRSRNVRFLITDDRICLVHS